MTRIGHYLFPIITKDPTQNVTSIFAPVGDFQQGCEVDKTEYRPGKAIIPILYLTLNVPVPYPGLRLAFT